MQSIVSQYKAHKTWIDYRRYKIWTIILVIPSHTPSILSTSASEWEAHEPWAVLSSANSVVERPSLICECLFLDFAQCTPSTLQRGIPSRSNPTNVVEPSAVFHLVARSLCVNTTSIIFAILKRCCFLDSSGCPKNP